MLGLSSNFSLPITRRIPSGLTLIPVLMLTVCAHPLKAASGPAGAEMPRAQRHESHHQIDRLEDQWRNALLKQDSSVMDKLLAEDYMAITSGGTLQTKEQTLANLRSGSVHVTALDISDRKVRFYGSTALVTSLAAVKGTNADEDISGSFRYTQVYVRDPKGEWKIVSFEASKIPETADHK
jgi:ketosteroid isomerase-like protein